MIVDYQMVYLFGSLAYLARCWLFFRRAASRLARYFAKETGLNSSSSSRDDDDNDDGCSSMDDNGRFMF